MSHSFGLFSYFSWNLPYDHTLMMLSCEILVLAFKLVQNIHTVLTAGDYNLLRDLLRVINEIIFFHFFGFVSTFVLVLFVYVSVSVSGIEFFICDCV